MSVVLLVFLFVLASSLLQAIIQSNRQRTAVCLLMFIKTYMNGWMLSIHE